MILLSKKWWGYNCREVETYLAEMERLHRKEIEELLDGLQASWRHLLSLLREYEQAAEALEHLRQTELELADRVLKQAEELKAADQQGILDLTREQEKAREQLQVLKERHRMLENMIAHMRTALGELDDDGDHKSSL